MILIFLGFVDLGSNNSGFYTLQAVLTHQGRSSSSGHISLEILRMYFGSVLGIILGVWKYLGSTLELFWELL